jgi:antitoxin MazE
VEASVARWGNSLALRIPKRVADRLGLGEGRTVDLDVEDGRLVVRPRGPSYRIDELLAGITPENLPDAGFDDGAAGEEAL